MACEECGTTIAAGVNFCPRCGAPIANAPSTAYAAPPPSLYAAPPPLVYAAPASPRPLYAATPNYAGQYLPRPRVQRHLQTLGILWCVFAAYRVVAVFVAMAVFKVFTYRSLGGGWPYEHDWANGWPQSQGFLAALLPVIAAVTIVATALAVFVGYSLLNRKPWGRTLALVAGVLVLFKPFLGMALGIYTLWVLAPRRSGAEYDDVAERR